MRALENPRGVTLMVVLSVICTTAAWGQTLTRQKPQQQQWLEFDRVKHNSTLNGRPATNLPIYAGRNGAKILYMIQLKRPQQEDLCVEVTTSYIGRFAKSDFQQKGKAILVKTTAVPRQATDMTLNVAKSPKGYRLTIAKAGNRLVCEVPSPLDLLDKLIQNPPANAPKTPLLVSTMRRVGQLEAQAEKEAAARESTGRKNAATPPPKPRYVEEVQKKWRNDIVPILKRMQDQSNDPPTPRPKPEGSGKKTVLPPFQAAGTRQEEHTGWEATGLAEKNTGQIMSLTIGTGARDKKERGESFSWIEHRWNCNKSGSLKAIGTFVEIHANGFSTPPVHRIATNTAYLYVGVRNERTQDDIWEEYSLGRSPGVSIPFANVVPLKRVTASGLDVQAGDEIVVLVGICDYSSAKMGGISNGEANARVQLIEIKVD